MLKVKINSIAKSSLEGMVQIKASVAGDSAAGVSADGEMIIFYPKKKLDEKSLKKGDDLYLDKESMCQCCNYYYGFKSEYEICPNCGWENDNVQAKDPDYRGGANKMSLNEAKEAYANGKEIK